MENRDLPSSLSTRISVNIDGAEVRSERVLTLFSCADWSVQIVDEDPSVETRDIYLPKHTEFISHIALDVSYFTLANALCTIWMLMDD